MCLKNPRFASPSLRGRGLKCVVVFYFLIGAPVALFARAWIEMRRDNMYYNQNYNVALFARAWIEMSLEMDSRFCGVGRPLCEGVD